MIAPPPNSRALMAVVPASHRVYTGYSSIADNDLDPPQRSLRNHMDTSLNGYSTQEQVQIASISAELPPNIGVTFTPKERLSQLATALEQRLVDHPSDAFLWYKLGETYLSLRDYVQGLRAHQRCYELEPLNPRALYGLATAYNRLSYTIAVDDFHYFQAANETRDADGKLQAPDPYAARDALQHLGMTADVAAQSAYGLFTQVRKMPITPGERQHIDLLLRATETAFPHIRAPQQQEGTNWLAVFFGIAVLGAIVVWLIWIGLLQA